jgi:hypothetical protein
MPKQHLFLWHRVCTVALWIIFSVTLFIANISSKNITLAESSASRNIAVMIVSPGKYPIRGKYLEAIGIEETKDKNLRITLFTPGGTQKPIADLEERWFIYPETPNRIWIYYGNDILELQEFSKNRSATSSPLLKTSLISDIPKPVATRIPQSLRNKLVQASKEARTDGEF